MQILSKSWLHGKGYIEDKVAAKCLLFSKFSFECILDTNIFQFDGWANIQANSMEEFCLA